MHIKTTRVTSQNYSLPLVTICHKSGDPLPPLGCDVIYGRPHGLFQEPPEEQLSLSILSSSKFLRRHLPVPCAIICKVSDMLAKLCLLPLPRIC